MEVFNLMENYGQNYQADIFKLQVLQKLTQNSTNSNT